MRVNFYQGTAILGSLLLMLSGMMRFSKTGSPKELLIAMLYFIANIIIFCF